jgi:phosphatidylglycerophosphate synthase
MIPQRMHIVLMDGTDPRFLGGSARARNARVARRAGADIVAHTPSATCADTIAVLVPSTVALMPTLFNDPAFVAATHAAVSVRLMSEDGAFVVVGMHSEVAAVATDPQQWVRLPALSVQRAALLNIATFADRRRATRTTLRATAKTTDGWVSRHFNRPVSRACSRMALLIGISANGASVVTLLVGLGCAWVAAQPGYAALVLTGVLFHLASVFDGVDGEIARATLTESTTGARVDTAVDQITYVACFAGLTIGWMREGGGLVAVAAAGSIGLALGLSLLRAGRFVSAHGKNASFVLIDRAVKRAARDTGGRALGLAAASFTLLRRDLFAVMFLAASLTGLRALIPALVLAGIVLANVTLSLYGDDLATAAAAETLTT